MSESTEASEKPAPPPSPPAQPGKPWMAPESRSRRIVLGLGLYAACLVVYGLMAGNRLTVHTPYNHFALQAHAWLQGHHWLEGGPPGYAGGNDFALFQNKWFISFPPFPAVLMLPLVWLAGSPENFRDGQFIVWLAGIGPAGLFLVLEKLRRTGRSERSEKENLQLALLFAFGTAFFFTAVQGTVWFAAHVVGVGLMALFVLVALDAERPLLAGALIGCMFLTRTTTLLCGALFVFEAIRVSYMRPSDGAQRELPTEGSLSERASEVLGKADRAVLVRLGVQFALPLVVALLFASWLNASRFHDPSPWAFGHEHLTVVWQGRIKKWGLFGYHYLPRNLAVMLASLPWTQPGFARFPSGVPFMISGHGLALWFTTPIYLWLVRPSRVTFLFGAAGLAALGPCVMNLLYQNSGWFQFAYRFSNDYAILLFVMLAVSLRRMGSAFWVAAVWAVAWNLFGAATFPSADHEVRGNAYYSHDPGAVYPAD
jgi:hypothetical protein